MTENFDVINAPQYFDFCNNFHDDIDDTFFDKYNEQELDAASCTEASNQEAICIQEEVVETEINFEEKSKIDLNEVEDPLNLDDLTLINEVIEKDNYREIEQNMESRDALLLSESSTSNEMFDEGHESHVEDQKLFRRSMSVGDLFYLEMALKSASLGSSQNQHSEAENFLKVVREEHQSDQEINRKCSQFTSNKRIGSIPQRSVSKESLNRLAQPKRKFGSDQNLRGSYVSMAEAVKKFQQSTPERFKTKPKFEKHLLSKLATTIPHSPHLVSNQRSRPVHAISHEEQERIEFEKAQKFKIKAHPLNKKILQGPLKPTVMVEKKPNTVPEPFKLTEVQHKVQQPVKSELLNFHAKPVPDYNKPTVPKSHYRKQLTKPETPNILKRYQRTMEMKQMKSRQEQQQNVPKQPSKLTKNTQPLPFSFEARNELLRKKKEDFVRKVYEEEKKAREFHARPIPKGVLQAPQRGRNGSYTQSSAKKETKNEENTSKEFKSKPPTVLYKKPFEPKKGEKPLTEIVDFQLNTDQRAREREYFDQLLKEKEEKVATAKLLEEQKRIKEEQEEIIRLRKMTEYKAQPVKKYKEVIIQPSNKITEPVSPNFHYKKHERKGSISCDDNKENSN